MLLDDFDSLHFGDLGSRWVQQVMEACANNGFKRVLLELGGRVGANLTCGYLWHFVHQKDLRKC